MTWRDEWLGLALHLITVFLDTNKYITALFEDVAFVLEENLAAP